MHVLNDTLPLCLENSGEDDLYEYGRRNNYITFGLENSVYKENVALRLSPVFLAPLSTCLQKFSKETVDLESNPAIFCVYSRKDSSCAVNTGSAIINNGVNGKMIFTGIASSFSGQCGVEKSFVANTKIQDVKVLE